MIYIYYICILYKTFYTNFVVSKLYKNIHVFDSISIQDFVKYLNTVETITLLYFCETKEKKHVFVNANDVLNINKIKTVYTILSVSAWNVTELGISIIR